MNVIDKFLEQEALKLVKKMKVQAKTEIEVKQFIKENFEVIVENARQAMINTANLFIKDERIPVKIGTKVFKSFQ